MHTQHGAVDEVALEDLSLYIQTTSQLYPRRQALQENIARRVENGTYDPGTAWKLALPLVNDGAHAYAREFRGRGNVFSRATREALAQRMAHDEYTEIVLQRQVSGAEKRRERENAYGANETRYDAYPGRYYGIWFNRVLDVLDKRGLDASITSSAVWHQLYNAEFTPEQAVDEVETTNEAVNDEAGEPRPWPRRSSAAREDGPGGSLRWIQTGDVYEAKAPLGGGKYVINVDPGNADGFQTWYLPVSKDDEAPMLGASTTLGGAMNLAKDHANAMAGVRRAAEEGPGPFRHEDDRDLEILLDVERPFGERKLPPPQTSVVYDRHYKILSNHGYIKWVRVNENEQSFQDHYELTDKGREALDDYRRYVKRLARGTANERVPVIHEGADVVAASVTTTETATVVTAKEDFKTAAMAEQHAYTEGFRYIAERGRKYDIYKRRQVGKKGYEKRELYHRRGKWHISGDKRFVSRLGRDARKILVDQGAKTIPIEHAAEGPKFERCVKSVKKRGEAVNPYAVCTTSVGQGREGRKLTLAQAKAELRPLGLTLTSLDGEYRVNFRRGNEESAYYTPDLEDAVATGKDMAKRGADGADDKDFARIGPRDRVTIVDRFGVEHTGRAVMRGPHGWVLNMGGKHGTPAIASPENIVRVRKARGGAGEAAISGRETAAGESDVVTPNGSIKVQRVGGAQAEMAKKDLGLIKVTRESAKKLYDAGVPITIVGSNVNSFHFFGGWGLAYTVDPKSDPGQYDGQFDVLANSFASYLEPELGRRPAFFYRAEDAAKAKEGGAPGSGEAFRAGGKDKAAREAYEAAQLKLVKGGKKQVWQVGDDAFTQAYVFAALWSSTDDDGEPLDAKYEPKDLARSTLAQMEADCVTFQRENERDLNEAYGLDANARHGAARTDYKSSSAGHDFWLTRNGHGAGFWDRGLGAVGDRLTKAAKAYGQADLYVGDDGKIYQAGAERAGRHGMHAVEEGGAEECAPCAAHEACEKHPKKRKDVDDTAEGGPTVCSKLVEQGDIMLVERNLECMPTGISIENSRDLFDYVHERYKKLGREQLEVHLISNQSEIIGKPIVIAIGQPDRVATDIEQVWAAVQAGAGAGARGFCCTHNHPSGGPDHGRLSRADKQLAKDIEAACPKKVPSTAFIDFLSVAAENTTGDASYESWRDGKVTKVRGGVHE